jgi:cellulose synthase/poly-beta-1,6-N-acetylglucosamine synthase-like glycosyltransferase
MGSEKRWIVFFFFVEAIWLTILSSLIYQWIYGIEVLVDTDLNLFYVTMPLLGLSLVYNFTSIFVFFVYIVASNRVKTYQIQKLQSKRQVIKKHVIDISSANVIRNPVFNSKNEDDEICSIIIPSRNEEKVIKETVHNCLLQTYQNIEVIVVCHNCTDSTFEQAQVQDKRVKVFDLKTKEVGKGIALNYGVENANGKFLLILDGDGRLSKDFIEKTLPLFEANIVAVQGKYLPSNRDYNFLTKLLSIEGDLWSTPYMTARSFLQKKVYLGGTGYIIRKDILIEVGKFSNHLVDDYELSCRLFLKKYKVLFAPLSIDYDEKPPAFQIMLRQRARWARGFSSMLKTKAVEPIDVIGFIYWLGPISAIAGIIVLFVFGYAAINNLLFGYYPYTYAYIPLNIWFILIALTFTMQCMVLVKEYGRKGLKYASYLLVYNPFSLYVFVIFLKGLFVKSWGNTKTMHGFIKESGQRKQN